ncbi:MAG: aminotransferase class I/II-fold pyridoxal phosphate-dependent enzyme [Alphaproteobacteria bacterium]|nr:aminotransferase class I/II-fold pyridoxal phosphate-dependent enzyme [Alphaproteobacteria bacterium]
MTTNTEPKFLALRPLLPTADELYPYLKKIDENRYYANFGPLVEEVHDRCAQWLNLEERKHVMTASSGMAILELLIQAYDIPLGTTAIMPSWTYIATPHAALNKGLVPYFVDVDPVSWALTPEIAEKAMRDAPGDVSLIMPVAPFGLPLPVQEWEDFSRRHNVRVIIDGAAMCLDDVVPSETVPTMVSFHATKMLNAAEGGLLIIKDQDITLRVKKMSHFGTNKKGIFWNATNAKMSEYHAAVLLASMDAWPKSKSDFIRVAKGYHAGFTGASNIKLRPGYGEDRFNSVCMIEHKGMDLEKLLDLGVETRHWWRHACHNEPLFSTIARGDLPVTDHLAEFTVGLPVHKDFTADDVAEICEKVLLCEA